MKEAMSVTVQEQANETVSGTVWLFIQEGDYPSIYDSKASDMSQSKNHSLFITSAETQRFVIVGVVAVVVVVVVVVLCCCGVCYVLYVIIILLIIVGVAVVVVVVVVVLCCCGVCYVLYVIIILLIIVLIVLW